MDLLWFACRFFAIFRCLIGPDPTRSHPRVQRPRDIGQGRRVQRSHAREAAGHPRPARRALAEHAQAAAQARQPLQSIVHRVRARVALSSVGVFHVQFGREVDY